MEDASKKKGSSRFSAAFDRVERKQTFLSSPGFAYGSAVGGVVVATLARFALTPILGRFTSPYLTYFPAVVLSAWVGGMGPGLLSVLLGALVAAYLFVAPAYSLAVTQPVDLWSVGLFLLVGFCITAIGEAQRRVQQALQQSRNFLFTTLRSIGDGVIATDDQGRIMFINAVAQQLTGWTEQEAVGKEALDIFRIVNETTRIAVDNPIRRVIAEHVAVGLANHTVLLSKDGKEHPIDDSGAPILDERGALLGGVLVFHDISGRRRQERALQESEARFRAIMDSTPSIIYVKDLEGRYMLVNRAFEIFNGHTYEEALGKTDFEIFPPLLSEGIVANDKRVVEAGGPILFEEVGPNEDRASTYLSTKFPLRDASGEIYAICGVSTDVTEQKREELARQFLTEATAVLASSLDYEQTLQKVANLAVPHIADWCVVDMLGEDGSISLLAVAHIDPEKVMWATELRKRYPPDLTATSGPANVLRTGRTEVHPDISDERLVASARDAEHLEVMRKIGFRSVMIVPIIARERILGAITFVTTRESGHLFTPEDQVLAEGLAARAALAIDNARLYREAREELQERRRVQDALRISEERFRFALANSDISVYMMDGDLRYTWVYSGQARGELSDLYGKTDGEFLEAEDAARLTEIKRRVLRTGIEERHTVRATRQGAEPRYYDTVFAPLRDSTGSLIGITGMVNDVTERKQAQDALAQHQAEIEALNVRLQRSMRETHHRVKNNLQIITALVNMQQMQYEDLVPVTELQRLTQHIKALASIHDLLTYQAQTDPEVSNISIKGMMQKLIPAVQEMVEGREITVEVQDLRLPIRQSTTFAVLVNELVSNALKHGAGKIQVRLTAEGDAATLTVTDEGPGFPEGFDPIRAAHTGLDLIGSLSGMDLHGDVRYENRPEGGACVVVEFPIPANASLSGKSRS